MPDVFAVPTNFNFIIALVAMLGTVATACKWSHGKRRSRFMMTN